MQASHLAIMIVLAPAICVPARVADAQQQTPLPEVTVTAPPLTPSDKKFTPYFGNPRVEEDKWPDFRAVRHGSASVRRATVKPDHLRKP